MAKIDAPTIKIKISDLEEFQDLFDALANWTSEAQEKTNLTKTEQDLLRATRAVAANPDGSTPES